MNHLKNAKFTLASGLGARSGIAIRPRPKLFHILLVLRLKYRDSILRIAASEIYRSCLRIRAILNRPSQKRHPSIPLAPMVDSDSFELNRNFALACSDHIRQQQFLYPWIGLLDIEMLGLAFRAGAEWHIRMQSNVTGGEDSQCQKT